MSFMKEIDEEEMKKPSFKTVCNIIVQTIVRFLNERPGQIIGSAFLLIMVWGYHGDLALLRSILPNWSEPGLEVDSRTPILSWVAWDRELISFWTGAVLLVIIPMLIIKFGFKQSLKDYGLGLPPKGKRAFAALTFIVLILVSIGPFYLATYNEDMQKVYPFYKPMQNVMQFTLYELTYLPFFIAIEFIFRGYLIFGLCGVRDSEIPGGGSGAPGVFYFDRYAILISMLSYTAWHLGKPTMELWGTPLWGLAAGATAYASRSIWTVVLAHWLLNVFLDAMILRNLGILFF